MKTINLEVKVKEIGKAVGTVGWFKEYLSDKTLELNRTKSGNPCIALRKDATNSEVIAFADGEENLGYIYHGGNVFAIHVEGNNYEEIGLVNYATNACYKLIDQFIDDCVEILKNYLDNEEVDYTINIKAEEL